MLKLNTALTLCLAFTTQALADPCGMVPPIYTGDQNPITRIGEQNTYVFYKDGMETFVIRPGFRGNVEEFGMLIPFPTPPAIRKVPDHIFSHLAAAVDPPEVVIDLRPIPMPSAAPRGGRANSGAVMNLSMIRKQEVRVLREEAVGMYEVAVLAAGSAEALKKWLEQHKYKYPDGMDKPCNEYVADGWCFVAVKTKVSDKKGVDPKPGQRRVRAGLPSGASFDGFVQGMGFRFKSDKLVVPMRLSAFNKGELRNIVYLLTDGPKRIRSIPEEYVMRQIAGKTLLGNVTEPLPLRIINGPANAKIPQWLAHNLPKRRNPTPKNGAAKELFATDLLAVSSDKLSLPHEEQEKEFLRIGERLGLRGGAIDKLHSEALSDAREKVVAKALKGSLEKMTLNVIDGDFPREVLAGSNLLFAEYNMPGRRNSARYYDAKSKGPTAAPRGVLKVGKLDFQDHNKQPWGMPVIGLIAGLSLALLSCFRWRSLKS
jgi:hypothetical protein